MYEVNALGIQRHSRRLCHGLNDMRSLPKVSSRYVHHLHLANICSLKYHRLHPEYVYTRIRNLQGKYNLRILLTMIDIPNHEDSLRELSKTSLVNNVTVISCWSAAEAARYLELYKSYEHANFDAIKGKQAANYADKLVDFVTVPRSLNKSDAVALVANFGSLKNAINADAEQLAMISGWGGVKIKRWSAAVDEPFRAKKAAKRGVQTSRASGSGASSERAARLNEALPLSRVPLRDMPASGTQSPARGNVADPKPTGRFHFSAESDDEDDEEALMNAAMEESLREAEAKAAAENSAEKEKSSAEDPLADGVAAALAKFRER